MKKLFLIAVLIYCSSNVHAQVSNEKFNLGFKLQTGRIGLFGIEGEYIVNPDNEHLYSLLGSLSANAMKFNTEYGSILGTGFEVGVGDRIYLNKKGKADKFYIDTYFNYGSVNFDQQLNYDKSSFEIRGNFKYLSLVNASLGYKFLLNKFILEPSVSVRYNIEIEGAGIANKKDINDFLLNAGLKLAFKL